MEGSENQENHEIQENQENQYIKENQDIRENKEDQNKQEIQEFQENPEKPQNNENLQNIDCKIEKTIEESKPIEENVDLEAQVVITPSEDSNQKQKKESEDKVEESQTSNGKKNPYDLRNKTQEKTSNFYNNDKIGEAINMKNEYEFIISKKNSVSLESTNNVEGKNVENKLQNIERIGNCHICKKRKTVYVCYTQLKPTSCQKSYCESCLLSFFNEKIGDVLAKNHSWKCPFKKKICKCKHCLKTRESEKTLNNATYNENKKLHTEKQYPSEQPALTQSQQYARAKNMQKLKSFIEFNGSLMMKFSKSMKSLNTQEVIYYHKIIYESLEKLEKIADFAESRNVFIKN